MCGMTRAEDAQAAVRFGVTALGFVFWPESPRHVTAAQAGAIIRDLPTGVATVGVFVNQPADEIRRVVAEAGLTSVQLHGDEPVSLASRVGRPVMKATSLARVEAVMAEWPEDVVLLLDAHDPVRRGGTGQTIDWQAAAVIAARRRVVLAGGLTPESVCAAIVAVRPYGVDVSSGVESAPGVKDMAKMQAFLEQVRVGDGR